MKKITRLMLVFVFAVYPAVGLAQYVGNPGDYGPLGGPYVPVYDETTNSNFETYIDNFNSYAEMFEDQIGSTPPNGTTDSLRDLLSGSNPGGLAATPCVKGNNVQPGENYEAFAYTYGPWASARQASIDEGDSPSLPDHIPDGGNQYVQVNYSHSLRCLLEDVVNWQKLGVSIQIHSLLKQYIADAQTKQLNNQLKNKIAAANLDWSRAGNQIDDGGVLSTQPVFNTNVNQSQYNVSNRQLEHIIDQAAADPGASNPVGSLGVAAPWRLDTAANMAANNRIYTEDPFNYTELYTQSQLTTGSNPLFANEYDWTKFNQSFNDPSTLQGGLITFLQTSIVPSNNPIGAASLADMAARGRIERQLDQTRQKAANSGFVPATECSGDASDPYCLDTLAIDTNPAAQNQQVVTEMAAQGDRQIEQSQTLDAKGGPAAEQQSTALNTDGGVLNYDTTPLATSTTVVNRLIKEMYDIMMFGYFGINEDTTDWAQATMLMIYDEMKFDPDSTEIYVTEGQDTVQTGY